MKAPISLLSILLLSFGCKPGGKIDLGEEENHAPEISGIEASTLMVEPGGTVHLKVIAEDPDDDPLTFFWLGTGGYFSVIDEEETDWFAPNDSGIYTISVKVEDGNNGSDSDSVNIEVSIEFAKDYDGDGYSPSEGDCDDIDDTVYPGAIELCDSKDNDCDGEVDEGCDEDNDGDGWMPDDGDCDDMDGTIYPGAEEIPYDSIDQDCDGSDLTDVDGDGFDAGEAGGDDCDDDDSSVYPGADEIPDNSDNDCDGTIDEGTTLFDDDGDGYSEEDGDCDDTEQEIYPGADETCGDGIDQDCDGEDENCCEDWDETYGNTITSSYDWVRDVKETSDGGFILTGTSQIYGLDQEVLLIKTDSQGTEEWFQTFVGGYGEHGYSVVEMEDGGYVVASFYNYYSSNHGWLIKTDSEGNEEWNQTFDGTTVFYSVDRTDDGGLIITGYCYCYNSMGYDLSLVKTDSEGNEEWSNLYGGTYNDVGWSVKMCNDGGYIIAGQTFSFGTGGDAWLVKTDSDGNLEWYENFGGGLEESAYSVDTTEDGGYIIAGFTRSYGAGGSDFYLIKTDEDGDEEWTQTFGGVLDEIAHSVHQTDDGGYFLVGYTHTYGAGNGDIWIVKTDSDGNMEWDETFGDISCDYGYAGGVSNNGGYFIAGFTYLYGLGFSDAWLIRYCGP